MARFIMHERDIAHIFEVGLATFGCTVCPTSSCQNLAPLQVSSLLSSPEMKARKAAGILIGDLEVVEAVLLVRARRKATLRCSRLILMRLSLQELAQPKYRNGVVVDGFPRTVVQAQFIHLLFE